MVDLPQSVRRLSVMFPEPTEHVAQDACEDEHVIRINLIALTAETMQLLCADHAEAGSVISLRHLSGAHQLDDAPVERTGLKPRLEHLDQQLRQLAQLCTARQAIGSAPGHP